MSSSLVLQCHNVIIIGPVIIMSSPWFLQCHSVIIIGPLMSLWPQTWFLQCQGHKQTSQCGVKHFACINTIIISTFQRLDSISVAAVNSPQAVRLWGLGSNWARGFREPGSRTKPRAHFSKTGSDMIQSAAARWQKDRRNKARALPDVLEGQSL